MIARISLIALAALLAPVDAAPAIKRELWGESTPATPPSAPASPSGLDPNATFVSEVIVPYVLEKFLNKTCYDLIEKATDGLATCLVYVQSGNVTDPCAEGCDEVAALGAALDHPRCLVSAVEELEPLFKFADGVNALCSAKAAFADFVESLLALQSLVNETTSTLNAINKDPSAFFYDAQAAIVNDTIAPIVDDVVANITADIEDAAEAALDSVSAVLETGPFEGMGATYIMQSTGAAVAISDAVEAATAQATEELSSIAATVTAEISSGVNAAAVAAFDVAYSTWNSMLAAVSGVKAAVLAALP